ncbi:MAG: mechanosensitive ion channel domain-containing protein [Candidatus Binatia bacterium]
MKYLRCSLLASEPRITCASATVEGKVLDVGFLATKLRTARQEEITIRHSVLVGTVTTNYSRLAG